MENLDSLKIASNLLKSEREKSSLTVEEVSFELKLDKKIIKDIESGNFNNFNSYLFLKGYVRNYANFLGVRVSLPEIKNKKKQKNNTLKSIENKKKPEKMKILILSLTLFCILLIFIIYEVSTNSKKLNDISLDPLPASEIKDEIILKENIERKIKNDVNTEYKTEKILIDNNNIIIEDSFNNDIQENLLNNNKVLEDSIQTNPKLNTDNFSESKPNRVLEITYKRDSWTEIIDSNGDIIFFDLVKKNKILKFTILAPFEILLGDATAVNIKYNDNIVSVPYYNPDTNVGKIKIAN